LIDQVAAENGGTFAFTITAFATTNYALSAQYLQAKLNSYNHMKVDIVTEASALHITNCSAGNYTTACGYSLIFDDPEPGWTAPYQCNASPSPTGWCNAQFDKDVLDQQQTLDANQRIADIKDMQKQFYAEVPALITERRYAWMFSAPNIQNWKQVNDGIPLIAQMWIKTHS
jgi:ABC-type transport system substrate-binding protein